MKRMKSVKRVIVAGKYAQKQSLSLSEHGIKIVTACSGYQVGQLLKFTTGAKSYKFLGLKYIEPSHRNGSDEIEQNRL